MIRTISDGLAEAFPTAAWLMLPAAGEVVDVLSKALSPDWVVEREIDYDGEVSIIALSTNANERTPAFMLYEKDGQTRVAMIRCDQWENDRGFTSFRQAMDAFVCEARASTHDEGNRPQPRRKSALCHQTGLQLSR